MSLRPGADAPDSATIVAGQAPAPPSPMRMLVAFGGLNATLAAGYGVLFTLTDDYRTEYGISESAIGYIIGAGFLVGFISQVLIAPFADRGHARKVVVIGVLTAIAGLLLMAVSTSFWPILLGRIVNGLGIGAAAPAVRRIVILADPENLGNNLGRLLSADVCGFALGPAISAVLVGPFGIPSPFIVVSVIAVVLLPFVARVPVDETSVASRPTKRLAFDLLRIRPFAGATVLAGVAFVMIGGFDSLWSLVHDELGTAEWIANLGITLFALPLIVIGPWGGRKAQAFGPFKLATIGLLAGAAFLFSYGLLPTGGLIFAVAMFHAFTDGATISASGVAAGMSVPDDRQAGAQGMLGASQALMAGIMAMVTGEVYGAFGRTVAFSTVSITMVVLIAVGVWLARDSLDMSRPLTADRRPEGPRTRGRRLPRLG